MPSNQAIIVDTTDPAKLVIKDVAEPAPLPSQAVVRVEAFSINRGEVRNAMGAASGKRPGWDLAGVVEKAAEDGSGPKIGARVVGMLSAGSWARRVAAPTDALAVLPENVSFIDAATLPVAGLTALFALGKGGNLSGKRVLVTGATGGTGDFLIQLSKLGGAKVVGLVRNESNAAPVKAFGADEVVVGDVKGAGEFGPFQLVIDSVGGPVLAGALHLLERKGTAVVFGATGGSEATIDVSKFYSSGPITLHGFILFHEFGFESAASGLSRLVSLLSAGLLKPHIAMEKSWKEIGDVAQQLMDRKFVGKAVMRVED